MSFLEDDEDIIFQTKKTKEILEMIEYVTNKFYEKFEKVKTEENLLDYIDLEKYTLKLLYDKKEEDKEADKEKEEKLKIIGKKDTEMRTGVVSIQTLTRELSDTAFQMDTRYGIMTRVGLHCAPSAHKTMGTYPTGTIRFSFGFANTDKEVKLAIDALKELLEEEK